MRYAPCLPLIVVALVGCAHDLRLVNLGTGASAVGTATLWDQSVRVTLPSGEIAEGEFVSLSGVALGEDSLFYRANLGEMLGGGVSGRFHGYAYLAGTGGTVIEIVFASTWTGHGFGFARTSSGEEYRISF